MKFNRKSKVTVPEFVPVHMRPVTHTALPASTWGADTARIAARESQHDFDVLFGGPDRTKIVHTSSAINFFGPAGGKANRK